MYEPMGSESVENLENGIESCRPGAMFYTSNAERESMIQAMEEFIAKFRPN